MSPAPRNLHASCVAVEGQGLLILGPSGAGKSRLALQMMALGAALVADDQVVLTREGKALVATAPPNISGLIEARGVGLLRATPAGPTPVALAVDLAQPEPDRLPPSRHLELFGCRIPLVLGRDADHLSYALLQYLRGGRQA